MARQHMYYDVSDLNARYDQIPLQGLGAGILTGGLQGSLSGDYLGALGAIYKQGNDVKMFQVEVNSDLKRLGCNQITVDGKLGEGSCGAARYVAQQHIAGAIESPDSADAWPDFVGYCKSFKYSCKGAAPTQLPGIRPPSTTEEPEMPTARRAGMSDTTWLLIGGGVAVAAVGLAVFMRKKKA